MMLLSNVSKASQEKKEPSPKVGSCTSIEQSSRARIADVRWDKVIEGRVFVSVLACS